MCFIVVAARPRPVFVLRPASSDQPAHCLPPPDAGATSTTCSPVREIIRRDRLLAPLAAAEPPLSRYRAERIRPAQMRMLMRIPRKGLARELLYNQSTAAADMSIRPSWPRASSAGDAPAGYEAQTGDKERRL